VILKPRRNKVIQMKIIQAEKNDLSIIQQIVYETIRLIYPNYYPLEVVDFFIDHHRGENILKDIEEEKVYLLVMGNGECIGTGTIVDNFINRVFILPKYQGKGYGTFLMDILEEYLSSYTDEIFVDASLPGIRMYQKRDYEVVEFIEEVVDNNRILFYPLMRKRTCRKKL